MRSTDTTDTRFLHIAGVKTYVGTVATVRTEQKSARENVWRVKKARHVASASTPVLLSIKRKVIKQNTLVY